MNIDSVSKRIRFAYPQIYYACHTRHVRRKSSAAGVSDRDSTILVHLDSQRTTTLGELAEHMDLAKSTLSEALKGLEALGYITRTTRTTGDRRRGAVVLTAWGVDAVLASSVLDADRLRAALLRLTPRQRDEVARALGTLARACRGVAARVDR